MFTEKHMIRHSRDAADSMTADEFHRQLAELLHTAAASDVDVRGGWTCRRDGPHDADWDVEIVEVATER
jgi:hypothetical protein